MTTAKRSRANPILLPNKGNEWEAEATFNGCAIKENNGFHLLYRAVSIPQAHRGFNMQISSIGHATSGDGTNFKHRHQLIKPEYEWEIFGCEDPRVTKLEGKYYIFYTALSAYPFSASGIKIGVAITRDFKTIEEKHLVTPFNSKAMALFPEKIKGKIVGILTANTDIPPSKIAIAFFDTESQILSKKYWEDWYFSLDSHVIPLQKTQNDHIEVGAPPVKTKYGWLLIYSYIKNYFSSPRTFGIEAVLLDLENPSEIISRTKEPLLVPEADYELYGNVPSIVFPSGAVIDGEKILIYYGAADTVCCLATIMVEDLIKELI